MKLPAALLLLLLPSALVLGADAGGLAPPPRSTPVMGWNAWNTFSTNGKPMRGGRKEYQAIADAMVESGMVAAGYTLLSTVCTGWQPRDPVTHELRENLTNWPGGMEDFAAYLHGKGMQLSVYTDAGVHNCCNEPGSLGYEDIDMKTFASWGADAVAVDYCGGPHDVEGAYKKFADAIVKSGRDLQLGLANLGRGHAEVWAPTMSQNMTAKTAALPARRGSWIPDMRLTPDIGNSWDTPISPTWTVAKTMDFIQGMGAELWSHGMGNLSGTFPNYGQMAVGVPPGHPTIGDPGLSLVEAQSHFSLWCMFSSLLLATNDVRKRDKDIEGILINNETLAINQDPWAVPAERVSPTPCAGEMWKRPLSNGDEAVLVLNRANVSVTSRIDFDGGPTSVTVRDMQSHTTHTACGHTSFTLSAHETMFVRLTKSSTPCTPPKPAACSPAAPPAPPHPPPHPPPAPPLPPCPAGFASHASGYWANADEKTPTGHSKNVSECGAFCLSKTGCAGYEVYDPWCVTEPSSRGGSACYTFSNGLGLPFTADNRGLIRTCVKKTTVPSPRARKRHPFPRLANCWGAGELTVSAEQWAYQGFMNVTNETWADYDLQYINPSSDWQADKIPDWAETIRAIKRTNPSAIVVGTFHTTEVWYKDMIRPGSGQDYLSPAGLHHPQRGRHTLRL